MPRDTDGYTVVDTWDTLGMRATRSDDTVLEGAFVPDRYIARVVPAGFAGADAFVLGIFAWAEPTFATVYSALAAAGDGPGRRRRSEEDVDRVGWPLDGLSPDDCSTPSPRWPSRWTASRAHVERIAQRLVRRRRLRRPVAVQTRRRQVPRRRSGQAHRGHGHGRLRRCAACSRATSSSASTAMSAAAASTQPTARSCTSCRARPPSVCLARSPAGELWSITTMTS